VSGRKDTARVARRGHVDDRTTALGAARPPDWEWSFALDGALALDASAGEDGLWEDVPGRREPGFRLKPGGGSGTVRRMPPPPALSDRRGRRAAHARNRRRHADIERRRRVAAVVAIAVVGTVTLLVTAFGGGDHPATPVTAPASASRLLPAGPPSNQAVARLGALTLDVPVNERRITAIGYFAAADGALGLTPIGTQANQGLLHRLAHAIFGGGGGKPRWYLLPGGGGAAMSALDVGAVPGTDVYAPVDGTVVGIEKVILDGKAYGKRIDIQPLSTPSLVVTVSDLKADPSLSVGSAVTQGSSKLGTLVDLSRVETQALSRYTNDAGNHVLVEVHAAATLDIG
jgi:hypothetical protein